MTTIKDILRDLQFETAQIAKLNPEMDSEELIETDEAVIELEDAMERIRQIFE